MGLAAPEFPLDQHESSQTTEAYQSQGPGLGYATCGRNVAATANIRGAS